MALFLVWEFNRINKKRDREEGEVAPGTKIETGELADKAPGFRYML